MSVVVPFYGSREDAASLLRALGGLALKDGDEVLIVDNSPVGAVPEPKAGARYGASWRPQSSPPTTRATSAPRRLRTSGCCSRL